MRLHVWFAAVAALLAAGTAAAQTITLRTLPEEAKRAYMSHVRENLVSLDGVQTRLAPGGQIRAQNNLLIVPAAIPRESLVKYQLDQSGQLYRAWILTPEEAARPDKYQPASVQGRPIEQVLPQYEQRPLRFGEKPPPVEAPPANTSN
jgi:hypothetical protein